MPAFFFDKFWRSKFATQRYVKGVIDHSINFREKRVLDFGCGTGSYSFLFDCDKYIGIDTDYDRIKYAKRTYPKYDFRHIKNGLPTNLGEDFDYIFIVSTLHHLNNDAIRKYFEQFYKILKPDGYIIGMEPCIFPDLIFNNWFMRWIDRGKFIRSEKDYKSLFEGLFNFNVQKKFRRHFVYNELFYVASKKFTELS